jgi:hypothetical protein
LTDTTTALVETLTAEVRVLMVGRRQVTLSVAKQLDLVPLAELTIFGRVKLGDVHRVIGVDRDGNLALASYVPAHRWEVNNRNQRWYRRASAIGPVGGFHVRQPDGQIKWVSMFGSVSVTDDQYQLHLAAESAPLIVLAGLK